MKTTLFALGLLLSSFAFGQQIPNDENGPKYTWFTPCASWNYDPQGSGYNCSSLGWQLYVYDTREIDRMIQTLEQKIAELERRVRSLEQPR